jgi:hypothetical protein
MRSEDYTADSLCRAMGLPGFVEDSWKQQIETTVRVVLAPSSHPELCVTLSPGDESSLLTVVALRRRRCESLSVLYPPSDRADVVIATSVYREAVQAFRVGHEVFEHSQRYVFVDGMRAFVCLASQNEELLLDSHGFTAVCAPSISSLSGLVDLAWQTCTLPHIRNALAGAGRCVELKYPEQEVVPERSVTRVAVFGAPEARREYFEQLLKAEDRTKPSF